MEDEISEADARTRYAGSASVYFEDAIMLEESNYGRLIGMSQSQGLEWTFINRQGPEKVLMSLVGSRIVSRDDAESFKKNRAASNCSKTTKNK